MHRSFIEGNFRTRTTASRRICVSHPDTDAAALDGHGQVGFLCSGFPEQICRWHLPLVLIVFCCRLSLTVFHSCGEKPACGGLKTLGN